jgi:hypothetical protein
LRQRLDQIADEIKHCDPFKTFDPPKGSIADLKIRFDKISKEIAALSNSEFNELFSIGIRIKEYRYCIVRNIQSIRIEFEDDKTAYIDMYEAVVNKVCASVPAKENDGVHELYYKSIQKWLTSVESFDIQIKTTYKKQV